MHSRYADHVGITYVLCSKLRQFSYEEIEFFLPQLCHLVISLDNDSMALEEFILDLCEESVNGALLASCASPHLSKVELTGCRPSGSSKDTSTTSPATRCRLLSKHADAYTTRCSASCLA